MAAILDFYRKCESKYEHLPISDWVKDDAEKILRDAKPGALLQLKTLFGGDEKLMFFMLQYLLIIPSSIRLHKKTKDVQRKQSKSISQKKRRFEDKLDKQVRDSISLYRTFNPNVDDKTLKEMTIDVIKKDKILRAEAEQLNETIVNYTKDKNRHGKINKEFKDIIYNTYVMSKGKSGNIAKLLNCLNFKTPQGKNLHKSQY